MKRFLRGPIVSLASQGIGLVQLAVILLWVGASDATDAYLYLFSLGLIPILILLVGLMYPTMLNEHRMSRVGLVRLYWLTPAASVLFVLGGTIWLGRSDKLDADLLPLVAALLVNAVLQASVWYKAVAAEAGGDPLWISGIALPANLLATVMLLPPWPTPEVAVAALAIGLVIGNAAVLILMSMRKVGQVTLANAPLVPDAHRGSYWFLGKASVGYSSQLVMQSIAVMLPSTGVTYLNIANKIVGSVSATFVNAVMPHVVHQASESPAAGRRFVRVMMPAVGGLGGVIVIVSAVWFPDLIVPAFIVGLWLLASTNSAISQRMAFKFLPSNTSKVSILVIVVIVTLAVVSANSPLFSLNVILAAFAAMDAATAMLLLWLLRDRFASLVMGVCLMAAACVWVACLV